MDHGFIIFISQFIQKNGFLFLFFIGETGEERKVVNFRIPFPEINFSNFHL